MTTPADRQRAYRDRKRGGPPRELIPCGTVGSSAPLRRHERAGEELCDACKAERARQARERYAKKSRRSS